MAIPTSRVKNRAEIKIDAEKCTGCGLFVIFGHPHVTYKKGLRRTFASTEVYRSKKK
jgi:hypothetical protein